MTMRGWLAGAAALCAIAGPRSSSAAEQAQDPAQIVRRSVDEALGILRDPRLRPEAKRDERINRVRGVADEVFDWHEMARRSLGANWRKLSPAEQDRFVNLFENLVAQEYAEDLDRFYGDEKVQVQSAEPVGEDRKVKTVVITHGRERVPIDYYMYRENNGSYRVYDFSVEGVSVVNHYRATFNRFLVNHSPRQLLERLEQSPGGGRASFQHPPSRR